jgi:hypothetical protein
VASYLYDKKKVSLPVISKLLRHKSLQTTEIYLQAIDPSFRETMRLLEGNVRGVFRGATRRQDHLPTTYSPTWRKKKGFKVLNPEPLEFTGAEAGI